MSIIRMRRNKATLPTSVRLSYNHPLRRDHKIRQWFTSCSLLALFGLFGSVYYFGTTAGPALDEKVDGSHRQYDRHRNLQHIESFDYDVIVIGSGPAGMTSALYAARSGWSVLVIGSIHDSVLAGADRLDNFPGVTSATKGLAWLEDTQSQLSKNTKNVVAWAQPSLKASGLQAIENGGWKVQLGEGHYSLGRAVIVASGSIPRRLELPDEETLWGKSVHSCAICDGTAYGDTDTVVVVGGGDAAVDAALFLQRTVKRVILVHRRNEFRTTNQQNLKLLREKVQIETPFLVSNYELENGKLVGVTLAPIPSSKGSGKPKSVPCDGVFLLLGSTPNTGFVGDALDLDTDGYIITNPRGEASLPGAFAAGDVVDRLYHQAITAASAGAQAALNAEDWLRQNTRPVQVTNTIPLKIEDSREAAVNKDHQPIPATTPKLEYGEVCNLTLKECILSIVQRYPLVVFSKPWCPFCKKALSIFEVVGAKPHVINLVNSDAQEIQATLATLSNGRRTVPNVFVDGKSIGGGDDVAELHNTKKLKTLLEQAKAMVG